MKHFVCALVAVLCLQESELDSLVRRLGDSKPEERERAARALLARGEGARAVLQTAAMSSDAEVALRARAVLNLLDENVRASTAFFPVGEGFLWVYATGKEAEREIRMSRRQAIRYRAGDREEEANGWAYRSFDLHRPDWMPPEDYLVEIPGGVRIVGSGDVGEVKPGANTLDTLAELRWEGDLSWSFDSDCG